MFPEDCFDEQFYATAINTHLSYEDFAAGRLAESEKGSKQRYGNTLRVLRRNRNKNVDSFLDWLVRAASLSHKSVRMLRVLQEYGAFDALKKHVLRAIQLRIFDSADRPSDVVETYTFTFRYSGRCGNSSALAGFDMRGPHGEAYTVKNARYALGSFIRRLVALCNTLPDLPGMTLLL